MQKLISIIIVNYNGKKWLKRCFDSLRNQRYKHFEIIFVDNGSKDKSVEFVKKNYPKTIIVKSKKNLGFSGGNNIGVSKATGEYILLLNNDTYVEKNFLVEFVKVFDEIPSANIAQSKIVLMDNPDILDCSGSFWTDTTFIYHVGKGKKESLKIYNKPYKIFSGKGASILIKKSVIDKIGLFDDDMWSYYEDSDFFHRAWIAGFECWYWPYPKVFHAQGGTSLRFDWSFVQFHNFKNKLLSFIKNFEVKRLFWIILVFLFFNIGISFIWLLQGKFKQALSLYKAILWNIVHLKETLLKRKKIQQLRKVPDSKYLTICKKNPRLSYYYYLFIDKFEYYTDWNM